MCGVNLVDRRRVERLLWMLDFNDAVDQLMVQYSGCWYGHLLR